MPELVTKRCSRCERTLRASDFALNRSKPDGLQVWCHDCKQAYHQANKERDNAQSQLYRATHREYYPDYQREYRKTYPKRKLAHNMITNGLISGKILREPCCICGTTENIQGHHPDYDKPFHVIWLCREHHCLEHIRLRDEARNEERKDTTGLRSATIMKELKGGKMKTVFSLLFLLLLAAGVGACEYDDVGHVIVDCDMRGYCLYSPTPVCTHDSVRIVQLDTTSSGEYIYVWDTTYDKWVEVPDTTRFYAKVDTCLTCPKSGYELVRVLNRLDSVMYWCVSSWEIITGWHEPITDTTWLPKVQAPPKVQVLLTPDKIKVLECILSFEGHNFPETGDFVFLEMGVLIPELLPCTRCGLEPKQ